MRILVLGATGMLGSDVVTAFRAKGHDVTAFGSKQLDLSNHKAVRDCAALSRKRNDWVINCAAYTAVDKAESEPELAWDVNEEGALNLAEKLENGPRLIHISTDFVFDGTKTTPYVETDEVNPLGVYGQTKLGGERNVTAMVEDAIIFRTSWLYGPNGKSFPKTMIQVFDAGKRLRVIDDQFGCPTYTTDLATACVMAVEKDLEGGLFHASGGDVMTWHQFAELAISTWLGSPATVEAIPTTEYPTPAKRPQYSVLDTSKLRSQGISPWRPVSVCIDDFCQRIRTMVPGP